MSAIVLVVSECGGGGGEYGPEGTSEMSGMVVVVSAGWRGQAR